MQFPEISLNFEKYETDFKLIQKRRHYLSRSELNYAVTKALTVHVKCILQLIAFYSSLMKYTKKLRKRQEKRV